MPSPQPRTAADEYLTVEEFAALTAGQQHAVWHAHALRGVRTITAGQVYRYNRADVRAVLGELERAR